MKKFTRFWKQNHHIRKCIYFLNLITNRWYIWLKNQLRHNNVYKMWNIILLKLCISSEMHNKHGLISSKEFYNLLTKHDWSQQEQTFSVLSLKSAGYQRQKEKQWSFTETYRTIYYTSNSSFNNLNSQVIHTDKEQQVFELLI